MDEVARYNMGRWNELAQAGVQYAIPYLDLDADSARELVDPDGIVGDLEGRDVLCLASGGGQQSAAFSVLGANVTVLDLSEVQLERDRQAAQHYGLDVRTVQGDMRDLSVFEGDSFDVVWHGHSINFVPDARGVFGQVVRVLRPGGIYHLSCANPYFQNVDLEEWNENGYRLWDRYGDGELAIADPHWTFVDPSGADRSVRGPREFRHTLETLVNGMIEVGFNVVKVREFRDNDPDAVLEPGTWEHFKSIAPPYLTFWAVYRGG